jgi:hypothetical protein
MDTTHDSLPNEIDFQQVDQLVAEYQHAKKRQQRHDTNTDTNITQPENKKSKLSKPLKAYTPNHLSNTRTTSPSTSAPVLQCFTRDILASTGKVYKCMHFEFLEGGKNLAEGIISSLLIVTQTSLQ